MTRQSRSDKHSRFCVGTLRHGPRLVRPGSIARSALCGGLAAAALWGVQASAEESSPQAESSFKVAALRVLPKRWDKPHNFQLLEHYARQAATADARLVVSCECFLDGYTGNASHAPEMTKEKYWEIGEPIDGPWMQRISQLANLLNLYLSVGFAELRDGKMYNSVAVYSPDGELALHYSKTHTTGEAYNTPGANFPIARTDIGTLGALICYDRRFPEVPRILALKGAKILLVPAYGSDGERNEALLRTRAWENSVWVVYVKQNQALIINPSGTIVARDEGDRDQLVFGRIDLNDPKGDGDILQRRNPDVYREIIERQSQ